MDTQKIGYTKKLILTITLIIFALYIVFFVISLIKKDFSYLAIASLVVTLLIFLFYNQLKAKLLALKFKNNNSQYNKEINKALEQLKSVKSFLFIQLGVCIFFCLIAFFM